MDLTLFSNQKFIATGKKSWFKIILNQLYMPISMTARNYARAALVL